MADDTTKGGDSSGPGNDPVRLRLQELHAAGVLACMELGSSPGPAGPLPERAAALRSYRDHLAIQVELLQRLLASFDEQLAQFE